MSHSKWAGLISAAVLAVGAALVFASEADELRERANAMRKEAAVLAERGHKEEADRLERNALDLLEAADRQLAERESRGHAPDLEADIHRLREQLEKLIVEERNLVEDRAPENALDEIRHRIADTEREVRKLHAEHERRSAPREDRFEPDQMRALHDMGRRIEHFRIAAEHLREAGAPDLANELMEKAEVMENEARRVQERWEAEHRHAPESFQDQIGELRREMQRLRAEVGELRRQVENR
jgi:hypothetical protein